MTLCRKAQARFVARTEIGSPAEIIDRVAREVGAHQIVMGTRGLGSLGNLFLGSVATKVVRLAQIPVTLVQIAIAQLGAWKSLLRRIARVDLHQGGARPDDSFSAKLPRTPSMNDPVATEEKDVKAVDVMTPNVVTIWSKASVVEAAKLMLERGISGLPVVNDEGRLTGMVTESDLFRRVEIGTEPRHSGRSSQSKSRYDLLCEYLKSRGQRVENIMSPDVIRVFENTLLAEVAALLDLKRIRRVPVMRDGKMVGIVSRADFGLWCARSSRPPLKSRTR
jgi:CBS domain-containing protein